MNLKHVFCLSGYGYLQDIVFSSFNGGTKAIAKIKVVTHYDMSNLRKDDVYIDCEISDKDHLTRLNRLIDSVRAGKEVLINIQAEYSSFVDAYSGLDPVDPSHIVTLQAKLRALDDCYIDGQLVGGIISHLRAVA